MRKLAVLMLLAAACGSDDECGEPSYGGAATDEAWHSMVDGKARAMAGNAMAPSFTAPAAGTSVPASGAAPRLTWTSPIARKVAPHLPPVTDDIYLVEVTAPGRKCPVSMLTTQLEWALSADDWATLKGSPGEMSASIWSAYLIENRITEGPFTPAAPLTFKVE